MESACGLLKCRKKKSTDRLHTRRLNLLTGLFTSTSSGVHKSTTTVQISYCQFVCDSQTLLSLISSQDYSSEVWHCASLRPTIPCSYNAWPRDAQQSDFEQEGHTHFFHFPQDQTWTLPLWWISLTTIQVMLDNDIFKENLSFVSQTVKHIIYSLMDTFTKSTSQQLEWEYFRSSASTGDQTCDILHCLWHNLHNIRRSIC